VQVGNTALLEAHAKRLDGPAVCMQHALQQCMLSAVRGTA
jgi:hypothetical protein